MKKMQDTISSMMDSLAVNSLVKGGVPAVAGLTVTFLDTLEQWLRIGTAGTGFLIALVVLFSRLRSEIKK